MPAAKDKGGAVTHRYRPASEYDDATLAQKREYWRTKKREQRARRVDRRGRSTQNSQGGRLLRQHTPASGSLADPSSLMRSNAESFTAAGATAGSQSSSESTEPQKKKWIQPPVTVNKVLLHLPASCSISAKTVRDDTATVKCRAPPRAVNRAITSPTPSKTQLNTNSSVPPARMTRITNGSFALTRPQPCVSDPSMQHQEEDALLTNVRTGGSMSVKAEGKRATAAPQSGTQTASVTSQRAKGISSSQPSVETEEERAAKRREHWRIKKREQRAKLAARIGKARQRKQGAEMLKTGLTGAAPLQHLPPHSPLKAAGQKQCSTRAKATFTSAKRESHKLQLGAARLTTVNLQIKVQNPDENRTPLASDGSSVKKPGESLRKCQSYAHLSNITRGTVRCKTPRQRFIDIQRNFMNQRNMRCKLPLLTSVFGSRNIPRIDPNDTPEQIIAKRREYWRIKKREQRAKLSMEVKARLKEKDSLMRRVKRYQSILEEMRRARALAQSAEGTLTNASETIGGFIKEDGTVSSKIPQAPLGRNTSAHGSNEELLVGSSNAPTAQPRSHPNMKRRANVPIRTHQPPQVKVSLCLPGLSINKPSRLQLNRPRTRLRSTMALHSHSSLPNQAVGQLTLTRPRTSQNAVSGGSASGSNLGGCVMKMAVSSGAALSLSALSLDPALTEEERMAKKREYWRIKKREQRAARAVRLKQGVLQARVNAALQRRRALSRRLTNPPGSVQPRPISSPPASPHANEIKQETESVPEVDLNSQPEQAICPHIQPPASPPPPPALQPDSDPALSADSQATTLLAVASMKKLLEESLSTVKESKCEQTDIKTETKEEDSSEEDMKPTLPQLFFEKDEVAPLAADLTLQIKSWQPDTDALVQAESPSPPFKDSPPFSETPSPIPASSEDVLPPTCEHSSQTPSNFIVVPSMEVSCVPSSAGRTQRLCSKRVSCSPEPPKLHHLPMDQLHPQTQRAAQRAKERCLKSKSPLAQSGSKVGAEHVGLTSLQRKREYWKLMKRQQRARLKARQKERHGDCSRRIYQTDFQAPGAVTVNSINGLNPLKPALKHKPSISSLAANTGVPVVSVASPKTCPPDQSPDTLSGVSCSPRREQNNLNFGPLRIMSDCFGAPVKQLQVSSCSREWTSVNTDEDLVPSLPTLKPPENPLSSINLQSIEPQGHTPDHTFSPLRIPCPQRPSPTRMIQPPGKSEPVSTMAPPKRIPGEPEEDFQRRKREYWRIKKKEQRARKAIQVKGVPPRRASNSWRPVVQAQEVATQEVMVNSEPDYVKSQDCGPWVSSSESQHLISTSLDAGSFPFSNYTAPLEDESEMLFADYDNGCEEGSVSDGVWRNRYLMDYDPLNQLLVCMVCGELQYSHSLEGVRAHIEDAHPDTLRLEARERQRILEAWDEQVSQRERFFTSQLQQHSDSLTETHENR